MSIIKTKNFHVWKKNTGMDVWAFNIDILNPRSEKYIDTCIYDAIGYHFKLETDDLVEMCDGITFGRFSDARDLRCKRANPTASKASGYAEVLLLALMLKIHIVVLSTTSGVLKFGPKIQGKKTLYLLHHNFHVSILRHCDGKKGKVVAEIKTVRDFVKYRAFDITEEEIRDTEKLYDDRVAQYQSRFD